MPEACPASEFTSLISGTVPVSTVTGAGRGSPSAINWPEGERRSCVLLNLSGPKPSTYIRNHRISLCTARGLQMYRSIDSMFYGRSHCSARMVISDRRKDIGYSLAEVMTFISRESILELLPSTRIWKSRYERVFHRCQCS